MSAKAVSEYTSKELLYRHLAHLPTVAKPQAIPLKETSDFDAATKDSDWLASTGVLYFYLLSKI